MHVNSAPILATGSHLSFLDQTAVWAVKNQNLSIIIYWSTALLASAFLTVRFLGPLNSVRNVAVFLGGGELISRIIYCVIFKAPSSQAKRTQILFNACWEKMHHLTGTETEKRTKFRELMTALARAVFKTNGFDLNWVISSRKLINQQSNYEQISSDLEKFIKDLPSSQFIEKPIAQELSDEELVLGFWPKPDSDLSQIVNAIQEIDQQKNLKDSETRQRYPNMHGLPIMKNLLDEAEGERDNAIAALKSKHWPAKPESATLLDEDVTAAEKLLLL